MWAAENRPVFTCFRWLGMRLACVQESKQSSPLWVVQRDMLPWVRYAKGLFGWECFCVTPQPAWMFWNASKILPTVRVQWSRHQTNRSEDKTNILTSLNTTFEMWQKMVKWYSITHQLWIWLLTCWISFLVETSLRKCDQCVDWQLSWRCRSNVQGGVLKYQVGYMFRFWKFHFGGGHLEKVSNCKSWFTCKSWFACNPWFTSKPSFTFKSWLTCIQSFMKQEWLITSKVYFIPGHFSQLSIAAARTSLKFSCFSLGRYSIFLCHQFQ